MLNEEKEGLQPEKLADKFPDSSIDTSRRYDERVPLWREKMKHAVRPLNNGAMCEPVTLRSSLPDIGVKKISIGKIIDIPLDNFDERILAGSMILPPSEYDLEHLQNIENDLNQIDEIAVLTDRGDRDEDAN